MRFYTHLYLLVRFNTTPVCDNRRQQAIKHIAYTYILELKIQNTYILSQDVFCVNVCKNILLMYCLTICTIFSNKFLWSIFYKNVDFSTLFCYNKQYTMYYYRRRVNICQLLIKSCALCWSKKT